jgi:sulfatase modifying factor 1
MITGVVDGHLAKAAVASLSYLLSAALLTGYFATSTLAQPADPAQTPGLVAEQPASEPFVKTDRGYMVPYTETIPGTNVTFEMIPVPGGEFLLGSPDGEASRNADEGPQVKVQVAPYWIGKHEVTWGEYRAYMQMYDLFKKLQRLAATPADDAKRSNPKVDGGKEDWQLVEDHNWQGDFEKDWGVDAVTTPTPLYDASFTYGSGEEPNQPAVTMTQFAARQYTKWLSGITGRDFRLPSEAEWEYAARAGTTTAYSFGDDPKKLGEFGWFDGNGDYQTHPVGSKKPNPWGLFDVHGNVAEWTLDEFDAGTYGELGKAAGGKAVNAADALRWPTKLFPRVIRGGSWLDLPEACRSAARQKSEEDEWKLSDPNLPLSPWWYTEDAATGVGMRIIRPLEPLNDEDKRRAWDADEENLIQDVRDRLVEGRGVLGRAKPTLPAAAVAVEKLDTE